MRFDDYLNKLFNDFFITNKPISKNISMQNTFIIAENNYEGV